MGRIWCMYSICSVCTHEVSILASHLFFAAEPGNQKNLVGASLKQRKIKEKGELSISENIFVLFCWTYSEFACSIKKVYLYVCMWKCGEFVLILKFSLSTEHCDQIGSCAYDQFGVRTAEKEGSRGDDGAFVPVFCIYRNFDYWVHVYSVYEVS